MFLPFLGFSCSTRSFLTGLLVATIVTVCVRAAQPDLLRKNADPLPPKAAATEEPRVNIDTEFQPGVRTVRFLKPQTPTKRRIIYFLPVESAGHNKYGSGLDEAKTLNLANRFNVVLAEPDFAQVPWYGDHPSDPDIRQESYFIKSVLPQFEHSLGWKGEEIDRYVIGFSKSGWGALVLLFRHSHLLRGAGAFDSPLMKQAPDAYLMGKVFGTQENFSKYQFSRLAASDRARLSGRTICLIGYGFFERDMLEAHNLLTTQGVKHTYTPGPKREHSWGSGWLEDAVRLVLNENISSP